MHISIVSPVYKAENIIDELLKRLSEELVKITNDYEIVLVVDGSPDNSWAKIEEHAKKDAHVKGILLSRNFGQHHAISAGLDNCLGDWVIVMDCDLQDRPEEIIKLYNEGMKGYDIVYASRQQRKDRFMKRMGSKVFYAIFSYLSGVKQDNSMITFGIYSKKAISAINEIHDPVDFSLIARWSGFKNKTINVEHNERFEGKSSYNMNKLIDLALTIAINYSDKPLKLAIKLGLFITGLSVVYTIYTITIYLLGKITISGYTSLIISIWFLFGLTIFILGIVGLYIGKIFDRVKERPIYILDQKINF